MASDFTPHCGDFRRNHDGIRYSGSRRGGNGSLGCRTVSEAQERQTERVLPPTASLLVGFTRHCEGTLHPPIRILGHRTQRVRRYHFEIENVRSHVRSLWIVIALESVFVLVLGFGLLRAPDNLTVHIPPDLRSGAVVRSGVPDPANVYAFAIYIFQQLYRWPTDGADDFSTAIFSLAPYLTPRYRESLIAEMELKAKNGELSFRERALQEIVDQGYEERRVDLLSEGVWVIWLDLELMETVKGMEVKRKAIRYPIRVVRYAIDPELNPWGLALDGFAEPGPQPVETVPAEEYQS